MNSSNELTLETIQAMRWQEENAYGVSDYLSCIPPQGNCALDTPVDASCRYVMAKWCCEIADFCKYKRETVAVAMNCLDRFMATVVGQEILLDRNSYQLASMTALYSSVKIHEQEAMDPNLISSLSRGVHSPMAVEAMEAKMLRALQWRVNPPTAMSFVRSMMDLVPHHIVGPAERETITEITKFQIELAVNEYSFSRFRPSTIAIASLLNSLESLSEDRMLFANFENTMACALGIDNVSFVRGLRIALYELMNGNDTIALQESIAQATATTKMDTSPCGEAVNSEEHYKTSPRSVNVNV
ncbi:cyclin-like protein [Nitzschia inconspicua]|uniref:Cyclin-like protein n=1 Tax=Nitzschia inconspicua TaxID=303405 RepID=A0A9K3LY35_9STRA|nr:cyclin-like protein [Nitzschia inconspicua]